MDQVMIMALIGIGLIILLLAILAIHHQNRDKRQKAEKVQAIRETTSATGDISAGRTPYFVACYRGNNARYFRVYLAAKELLFLSMGGYFFMIDPETPRGTDDRHWLLRSAKMLYALKTSGLVVVLTVAFVVVRAIQRNAPANPNASGDILVGVFGIFGVFAVVIMILVPATLWWMTRRGQELDLLSLNQLREKAETDDKSFRAGPENVSELKIALLDQTQDFKPSAEVGGVISFKHTPTGKWKIETLATQDTQDAIESALAIWGREKVEIEPKLLERLAEAVEPGERNKPPVTSKSKDQPETALALPEKAAISTFDIFGCGTMICEGRGLVEWKHFPDNDAILAFCLFGVPLIPYRAVHISDWHYYTPPKRIEELRYSAYPISWSWGLLAFAYVRRLWIYGLVIGSLLMLTAYVGTTDIAAALTLPDTVKAKLQWLDQVQSRRLLGFCGLTAATFAILAGLIVRKKDKRHQEIRLLLGRHLLGSSDPATWTDTVLEQVRRPEESCGTLTYAAAVPKALADGDIVQALFAARLSTTLEDWQPGEDLTDTILNTAQAKHALEKIRKRPISRDEVLGQSQWEPLMLLVH